jgi:hypothetical protein
MPKITPQQNVAVSFRITPSMDAAIRRTAEQNECEPGDVLRVALYRWAMYGDKRVYSDKTFVGESNDWLGVSPRLFSWPYGVGSKDLPKERKATTVCIHIPGRAEGWYQQAARVYSTKPSLLFFVAVAELLKILNVNIHDSNRPVVAKADLSVLEPPSSASFEVEP